MVIICTFDTICPVVKIDRCICNRAIKPKRTGACSLLSPPMSIPCYIGIFSIMATCAKVIWILYLIWKKINFCQFCIHDNTPAYKYNVINFKISKLP